MLNPKNNIFNKTKNLEEHRNEIRITEKIVTLQHGSEEFKIAA